MKGALGWKIDKWDWQRNISFYLTLLLRHAQSGDASQPVQLAQDGTLSVETILGFRGSQILGVTRQDLQRIYENRRKQRFLSSIGTNGEERLCSAHGHSGLAHSMVNDAMVMDEVSPGDAEWNDVLFHGTVYEYAPQINQSGLKAGGLRGLSYRAHIHLAPQVDTHGEREGARGGSNVLVSVDALSAHRHGAKFYLSRTQRGVVLTAGLTEKYLCGGSFRERVIGLPPEFSLAIVDRVSGLSVVPAATAEVNAH